MGNYVTIDDVRAEGVGVDQASDLTITARIAKWEAIVERLTNNVFRILSPGPLTFDGNNTRRLHFNTPLVAVTSIAVNGESAALTATEFRAFVGRMQPQDNRGNPKIELTGNQLSSIFHRSHEIFIKGLDQVIDATWGYVEADDSTPAPVMQAITALVIRDLRGYFDQYYLGNPNSPPGIVRRERTDGHEIEYAVEDAMVTWAMIPNDIRDVLGLYRGPLRINAPEPVRFNPGDVRLFAF